MSNPRPPAQRWRLTYSKKADARYMGHLDEARFWERVFRRVELPLAYSHGFNPQARIQFAAALPVGVAGENELLDIFLTRTEAPQQWLPVIARSLPSGFVSKSLQEIPLKLPAMQTSLRAAVYRVCWPDAPKDDLAERARKLLMSEEILRPYFKKPNKSYNLRPRILAIVTPPEEPRCLRMTLQAGSQGNARINEVIAAMGLAEVTHAILREKLILDEHISHVEARHPLAEG